MIFCSDERAVVKDNYKAI